MRSKRLTGIWSKNIIRIQTQTIPGRKKNPDGTLQSLQVHIPVGIDTGKKIRLRGKGMPLMKDPSDRGDEYATVQIQVPKHLNAEAKQKLREYKTAAGIA